MLSPFLRYTFQIKTNYVYTHCTFSHRLTSNQLTKIQDQIMANYIKEINDSLF